MSPRKSKSKLVYRRKQFDAHLAEVIAVGQHQPDHDDDEDGHQCRHQGCNCAGPAEALVPPGPVVQQQVGGDAVVHAPADGDKQGQGLDLQAADMGSRQQQAGDDSGVDAPATGHKQRQALHLQAADSSSGLPFKVSKNVAGAAVSDQHAHAPATGGR